MVKVSISLNTCNKYFVSNRVGVTVGVRGGVGGVATAREFAQLQPKYFLFLNL